MENRGKLAEGVSAVKNVTGEMSWFRGTAYYWAEASLPFAHALACVEVVSKSSEAAEIVHNKPVVLQVGLYLLTTGRTSG